MFVLILFCINKLNTTHRLSHSRPREKKDSGGLTLLSIYGSATIPSNSNTTDTFAGVQHMRTELLRVCWTASAQRLGTLRIWGIDVGPGMKGRKGSFDMKGEAC